MLVSTLPPALHLRQHHCAQCPCRPRRLLFISGSTTLRNTRVDTAACSSPQAALLCAMAIFEVHLVRRAVETLAVMVYPPDAKMHLIAYIFGLRCVCAWLATWLPRTCGRASSLSCTCFHASAWR
jgi:hypothetical protein